MTTQTNLTRQQAYEARVKAFAENKTFQYLTSIKVKRGDIRCDACGSKLVQSLRLIQDNEGHYYLIGINCHTELYNKQKMCWGVYPHNPQESERIAERLVAERKGCNGQ
jgi:hypothetical protein